VRRTAPVGISPLAQSRRLDREQLAADWAPALSPRELPDGAVRAAVRLAADPSIKLTEQSQRPQRRLELLVRLRMALPDRSAPGVPSRRAGLQGRPVTPLTPLTPFSV